MVDILINDWLEEYDALTESEIHTYATEQDHNYEVMIALFGLLEEPHKFKSEKLIDSICQQLFSFYRSGEKQLKQFTMQYIPTLVLLHLSEPKNLPSVGTLLVSLYNLEVIDSNGQAKVISFRVPSIAQSSIYHDSTNLEPAFIAENALRRWEDCNTKLVNWGPLPQVENLNAQNRQRVVTALLFLYNQEIPNVSVQGLEHACKAISRLVSQGFLTGGSSRGSTDSDSLNSITLTPRLVVSSPLLLELLYVVYHSLERGATGAAHTLHDLTQRALYETFTDVLLVAHAIKNLVHRSPAICSVQQVHNTVSKSMITNASFRTKKLPDDIPIQADDNNEATLGSITEEQEDGEKSRSKPGSALKHLPKIPGLSRKAKGNKGSPTPQRNSLEMTDAVDMHVGSGDQVSLVSGAFSDTTQEDGPHSVHVSAV